MLGCSKAMVSLRSRDVSTLTISTRTWKNEPDPATYSSTIPLLLVKLDLHSRASARNGSCLCQGKICPLTDAVTSLETKNTAIPEAVHTAKHHRKSVPQLAASIHLNSRTATMPKTDRVM